MEFIQKYLNLKKLNRRDKYIVYGVGCLLGLLIIVQFIIRPFFENRNRLERTLQTRKVELEQMRELQADYKSLKGRMQLSQVRVNKRQKGFTLNSFLVQAAGQVGIKDRISSMKPTTTTQKNSNFKVSRVEMKLDAISLEQLTAFLHGVETSPNIVMVKKLSVSKKDKKEGLINVIMQVETIEA
ncbi:MAG: type II secretion system protein M [Deltaproteobacteria bacterium]|nr:type II secretion system protein M [Deltaproteobacteria bacterium]